MASIIATPCDLVTVSWIHDPGVIRLTEITRSADSNSVKACYEPGKEIVMSAEAAWRMVKSVTGALETIGFLPTQQDFEEYRSRIVEEMHEIALEEASG